MNWWTNGYGAGWFSQELVNEQPYPPRIHEFTCILAWWYLSAKYCWAIAKIIAPELKYPEFWVNQIQTLKQPTASMMNSTPPSFFPPGVGSCMAGSIVFDVHSCQPGTWDGKTSLRHHYWRWMTKGKRRHYFFCLVFMCVCFGLIEKTVQYSILYSHMWWRSRQGIGSRCIIYL